MSDTDTVPVLLTKYDNPTNIEYDDEWTVTNHDELEKTYVVRGMVRDAVIEHGYERDIIEETDDRYRAEFGDLEVSEEVEY